MTTVPRTPENVGVINPFALAEVVLKKRVNWQRVADPDRLLEETLGMPYGHLFDPMHNSPLYAGLKYQPKDGVMTKEPCVSSKSPALVALADASSTSWIDPGDFFDEGTEMTDPVQGALGDCYLIAALSSVAWARPYVIAQRTRATGPNQQDFVDMIELFAEAGGAAQKIEVSEKVPLDMPGSTFKYARSSEAGEIWPAVYEKAYAKWRTHHTGDTPDYTPIAGGDPVRACTQLTGLKANYVWTTSLSADDIWNKVRANSISRKTFNPTVAWTYSSGEQSPDKVNYSSAHLAANHAYSVFGWQYANGQKYIVLRNPWGTYEATLNVDGGMWMAWDAPYYGGTGFWRSVSMPTSDGIFALRADTFKQYFAGFGWVTTPEAP